MAGIGPLDANNIAEAFLDAVTGYLDTLPAFDATLEGAPALSYVATGEPALDCEQAVVWISGASEFPLQPTVDNEFIQGSRGVAGRVNAVAMTVGVVRCIPTVAELKTGKVVMPTVEALNAASRQTNADLWCLWCGLNQARRNGIIATECEAVTFGIAQPYRTEGGLGGWRIPLTFQTEGYKPEIGS